MMFVQIVQSCGVCVYHCVVVKAELWLVTRVEQ